MQKSNQTQIVAKGLLGAVLGGVVGYYAFLWIGSQGFYALPLPPVLLGWGAARAAGQKSVWLARLCAVAGLIVGLWSEWRFRPFLADNSLPYFLSHLHELEIITWLMLALGVYFSYKLPLEAGNATKPAPSPCSD